MCNFETDPSAHDQHLSIDRNSAEFRKLPNKSAWSANQMRHSEKFFCFDESCDMSVRLSRYLRPALIVLSTVWAQLLLTVACPAQEAASPASKMKLDGRIADQPIVVGYARNVTPGRALEYMKNLTGRLEIGKTMRESLNSEQQQEEIKNSAGKVEEPLYGFAGYMVQSLIPSYESISFQQVADEDDARRIANYRKSQWGQSGSFEDLGNGCFRVQYRHESSYPLPSGANEKQYTNQNSQQSRGYEFSQEVVEKDGVKMVQQRQIITNLFRYHDTILYEAEFEDLFTMELPTAEGIRSAIDGSTDIGFKAYLDRIPLGMRQLGWSMLSAAAGSQMQQRDNESETSYNMRRSSGDMALALIQAVIFDVDSSDGWARFANAEDGSLRGQLRVRARNNSQLGGRLLEAAGTSRFAPILSDDAAATFHLCAKLPEDAPAALQATATWLNQTMGDEFSADPQMVAGAEMLAGVLTGISEHRNLELLMKAGWTKASDGVFYGGMQLNDNPELLKNVHYVLLHLPNADEAIEKMITLEDRQGLQVIVFRFPEEVVEGMRQTLGVNITHMYLAHQNSCLWYAAGTENAVEIIRQSVERCTQNTRAARTPLVSGRLDMERWLGYPQDDPAKITSMLHWLDENAYWFPPTPMMALTGLSNSPQKPSPLIQRAFDLGGAQQVDFSLEADESGLLLQVSLGEAVANYMVARMIDAQETMMEEQRKNAEEMQRKQEAALKEAAKKVQPPPLSKEDANK
jgi:hypothetical protein